MRRTIAISVGWVAAAATAVTVASGALSQVGGEISGREIQPMSDQEIDSALQQAANRPQTPPPAAAAPAGPGSAQLAKQTDGGSVVAECTGALPHLLSWSPEPGYEIDDAHPGPGAAASVTFDGDELPDHLVVTRCANGRPEITDTLNGG
jgi:hypothetical protein